MRHDFVSGTQVLIRNATLFDSERGVLRPRTQILIEGARIIDVRQEPIPGEGRHVVDAADRVVLPGLIDAHVHVVAYSADIVGQAHQVPSLLVAHTAQVMRAMLHRGFTSVRDAAGADWGLQEAVATGLFEGPRLYIAGLPISQTGGHADLRPRNVRHRDYICSCAGLGLIGAIADGVSAVRRATREQVRTGANQIKIMAGGGVASPTDPLEGTQFSEEELRAICEEAAAANLYAMAHAYSPRAVSRAVRAGVRSIEHGNLIDEPTVRLMKTHGAFLVPTLSTYEAAADAMGLDEPPERRGSAANGWSPDMGIKLKKVRQAGLASLNLARSEGVPIVFGTDLLGDAHARQCGEFDLRAGVMTPVEQLQSATSVAARMMGQVGQIGAVAPGAWADLIMVDGDPTQDIKVMSGLATSMRLLMQSGRVVSSSL